MDTTELTGDLPGLGMLTLSDITTLFDHVYISGSPIATCP